MGLTPRQLSKKMGVTFSMADFITQSYRSPAACTSSLPQRRKPTQKSHRASNDPCRSGAGETTVLANPSACHCRKRRRPEEKLSDCCDPSTSSAESQTKKPRRPLCSQRRRDAPNKDNCKWATSPRCSYRRRCRQRSIQAAFRQRGKCLKGRRKSASRRKRNIKAKCKRIEKPRSPSPAARHRQKKRRMVPINFHLDISGNIFLDDKECKALEEEARQCCKGTAVQAPSLHQKSNSELKSDACERPEYPTELRSEECEDQEDNELAECVLCEDLNSGEEESCDGQKAKDAGDDFQTSWWDKFHDTLVFLESFLASLIKC